MENQNYAWGVAILATLAAAGASSWYASRIAGPSPAGTAAAVAPAPPTVVYPGMTGVPEGLLNGHLDLDTSKVVYPSSNGTTDHHVSFYDKRYETTSIDFFNLQDPAFDMIQKTIPSTLKRFILLVVNGQLSPGGIIEINGTAVNVLDYQSLVLDGLKDGLKDGAKGSGSLPVYTLGQPEKPGDIQLQSLRLGFAQDVLAQGGLVASDAGCVRQNLPGKFGEYRDGALTIQALDADSYAVDPANHAASVNGGGLLWEANVFWHWTGSCYGYTTPIGPPAPPQEFAQYSNRADGRGELE